MVEKQAKSTTNPSTIIIQTVEVTIVGDSPLVTHQWSEKAKKEMRDKQTKAAKGGKTAKDPERDYRESMYEIAPGKYGFPAVALKAAMVTACTSIDGMTKVMARQSFHVQGEMFDILCPDGPTMREDMVRIGMGTADIRYRGQFWPWSARVSIRYNAGVISEAQLINLINTAGFGVGIGEWRPEKNGQFGLFHAEM